MLKNMPTINLASTMVFVLAVAVQLVSNGNAQRLDSSTNAGELDSYRDVSLDAFTTDGSAETSLNTTDVMTDLLPTRKIAADELRLALKPTPTQQDSNEKREYVSPFVNQLPELSKPQVNRFRQSATHGRVFNEMQAAGQNKTPEQNKTQQQNATPQQNKDEFLGRTQQFKRPLTSVATQGAAKFQASSARRSQRDSRSNETTTTNATKSTNADHPQRARVPLPENAAAPPQVERLAPRNLRPTPLVVSQDVITRESQWVAANTRAITASTNEVEPTNNAIPSRAEAPCPSPAECKLSKSSEAFSKFDGDDLFTEPSAEFRTPIPQETTFGDGSKKIQVLDSNSDLDKFYKTYTTGTKQQHSGEDPIVEAVTQLGVVDETSPLTEIRDVASQPTPVESCLTGSCFDNSSPTNGVQYVPVAVPPCDYFYAFKDSMYVYRSGGESGGGSRNDRFAEEFDDFELSDRFAIGWENGFTGFGIDGRFWRVDEWGRTQRGQGNLTVVGVDIGNGNSTARYESDLKSVELNVSKYLTNWTQIGFGPRWMNLDEHAFALGNGTIVPNLDRQVATRNELLGGQVFLRHCLYDHGGDLEIDFRANMGLFHNEIDRTLTNFGTARLADSTTSVMLETEISGRYYLSHHSFLRFGYQFSWISDLALSIDQFMDENEIRNDSDLYLHGLFLGGGLEW